MFPPSVNLDNIDWSTRRLQIDFPVQVLLSKEMFFSQFYSL
ncbi:putative sulfite oxidase [Helianthus annuus]|uniref:Sulfite oxidase n=1 Tax=Helianthus annuus TaxID=4232 RepID=A0A9K3IKJ5_HELAN|nr:putative sulfite oxidase [Helianthus annuus]KAJ0550281.1 putative sulfite oxidase [Helianthus annuus]KAJ0563234.1 putative sulfite oxidase [Helianthus annuus]KAJ0728590.1 putative sulfite oxidase [Helianthus annuus]KAJ0731343.1 putative sulfite oxidase [Helianthus annuus]